MKIGGYAIDRSSRAPSSHDGTSSHGDFASAFQHALVSVAAFAVGALALALADALTRKR